MYLKLYSREKNCINNHLNLNISMATLRIL